MKFKLLIKILGYYKKQGFKVFTVYTIATV